MIPKPKVLGATYQPCGRLEGPAIGAEPVTDRGWAACCPGDSSLRMHHCEVAGITTIYAGWARRFCDFVAESPRSDVKREGESSRKVALAGTVNGVHRLLLAGQGANPSRSKMPFWAALDAAAAEATMVDP